MNLGLELSCRQELRLAQKLVFGAICQSCFPKSQAFVMKNQEMLLYLPWDVEVWSGEFYNDIIDMIFCNLYPWNKKPCRAYYRGKGKLLIETFNAGQLGFWDVEMLRTLKEKVVELRLL